jgi:hypothetical protein
MARAFATNVACTVIGAVLGHRTGGWNDRGDCESEAQGCNELLHGGFPFGFVPVPNEPLRKSITRKR